ncbi:MAG: pyridoxamine 5'-phosphate oxidase family protein [Mycobacteriaceae bacterium]|nr:pyridoxamine 5'-phosphate oxidase family protein [Mycobacteriaceae bacterium]
MAHDAEFDDVRRLIGEFGSRATLVSVNESLRPHVVTAMIGFDRDRLVTEVGSRTRSNVTSHPGLTIVWNPTGAGEYQLIVDGTAEQIGKPNERDVSMLRIAVVGGILHRLAGLPDGPPTCLSLAAEADAGDAGLNRGPSNV